MSEEKLINEEIKDENEEEGKTGDEEIQTEQPEEEQQGEEEWKQFYQEILDDVEKYNNEVKNAFAIGRLTYVCGQELLQIYGIKSFVEALDKVFSAERKTMLELIRKLEPDANKRNNLFRKIREKMDWNAQSFKEKLLQTESFEEEAEIRHKYAVNDFGPTENNMFMREKAVSIYENSEGILGKLLEKDYDIWKKTISELVNYPFSVKFYDNVSDFQNELEEHKGDLSSLVYKRYENLKEFKKEYIEKSRKLIQELEEKIQNIKTQREQEKENEIKELLAQIDIKTNNLGEEDLDSIESLTKEKKQKINDIKSSYNETIQNEISEYEDIIEELKSYF